MSMRIATESFRLRISLIFTLALGCIVNLSAQELATNTPVQSHRVFDRSQFPEPVFDREPGFVELYWKACELACAHVLYQPGMPQSPYMDEAFSDDGVLSRQS